MKTKNRFNKLILALTLVISANASFAQCPAGEAEVTIIVHSDNYGYEGYWQLLPNGSPCGTGTIAEGGNPAVGCGGAGLQNQIQGGYADNVDVTEGPWCLPFGNQYDLFFADDWGDGGFSFDILVNGFQVETFDIVGLGGTFTFTVEEPPAFDLSVFGANLYSYVTVGSYDLEATVFNQGTTEITSYDLNYSVDNGAAFTHSVTTSLTNYSSEHVDHSIPINIPTNGVYTIKIWATNLNGGNADLVPANDTLTRQIEAGPGRPNIIDQYVNAVTNIVTVANSSNQVNKPTDLDFHPVLTNNELWVTNKGTENSGGSTVTIYNAGQVGQTTLYKQDGNAWHFMSLPTGIAFSQNGNWANSPGVYDANHNGGSAFTGPALWSSDMTVYAQPSGGNGSHLDMLHQSPECQGIAAEKDNVFWVFDGYTSDLVRYDFAEDHGPGADFHGDAIIRRYSDDAVVKDPNDQIVSHLVLDDNAQWLYTVDHGNQRVIRIDINTGSNQGGAPNYPLTETVIEYSEFTGYTQETVITGLDKPAGIDVIDDRMIISEYQTGEIVIYDISTLPAVEIERISTGYTSVQGIKIGPSGKIWFVDYNSNGVYKIESDGLGIAESTIDFTIYPNPTSGVLNIAHPSITDGNIEVRNISGAIVHTQKVGSNSSVLNLNVVAGLYFVTVETAKGVTSTQKVIVK